MKFAIGPDLPIFICFFMYLCFKAIFRMYCATCKREMNAIIYKRHICMRKKHRLECVRCNRLIPAADYEKHKAKCVLGHRKTEMV